MNTQPYKGARDFYPEDKRLQKWMFSVWRTVCERYGYEEYDAPILESTDLYLLKGSQEIIDEQTYTFTDRGGRSVTIRTEMTPTVSRMVAAKRQELVYPVRWYSIPNLWRYERPQRGRSREFWQLNVDIFGVSTIAAEHEVILLADGIMQAVGAKRSDYTVRINSRKLVDYTLTKHFDLNEVEATTLRRLIDRKAKMSQADFMVKLEAVIDPSRREAGVAKDILSFLEVKSLDQLPPSLQERDETNEIAALMTLLEQSGVHNAVFDPTLMRGFDYYTDIVFEVFDTDPENNRSMFGGGRYDGLVGLFGVEPVPTVGFGMGDATFLNFLETHKLLPVLKAETELYVALMDETFEAAQKPIAELREMGLNVFVDTSGRKLDKQLKAADKKQVRNVLIIGHKELSTEQYVLKDLKTGEEQAMSLQRIVGAVKDFRKLGS